jgi:hypothetical protein
VVSTWIVQQGHLSHSPSQCGLDGSHCRLDERIVGEAIDCKSIVGETIIGGTIDGESIISVSGVIVGVAIVREAIMGGDGAVLAGRGGNQRRIAGVLAAAGMSWEGNTMIWRRSLVFVAAATS